MQRSHEHDADHGLKCAERKLLGTRQKIPGCIIHEHVERAIVPDHAHHFLDRPGIADVAAPGMNAAAGALAQLAHGCSENFFAASANIEFGTKFEKLPCRSFAKASAAASNEDALVEEKIGLKHGSDCKW